MFNKWNCEIELNQHSASDGNVNFISKRVFKSNISMKWETKVIMVDFTSPTRIETSKKLKQSKEEPLVSSYMAIFICNMIISKEKGQLLLRILI